MAKIYLLRHGESTHNVAMKEFMSSNPDKVSIYSAVESVAIRNLSGRLFNYLQAGLEWWQIEDAFDPAIPDAGLTDSGFGQARALQTEIGVLRPSLLVLSPLTRNLQTAEVACHEVLCDRNGEYKEDVEVFITPILREHTYSTCDVGSAPILLAQLWPQWTDQLTKLPDAWWAHDAELVSNSDKSIYREPWQKLQARVADLVSLLAEQASTTRETYSPRRWTCGALLCAHWELDGELSINRIFTGPITTSLRL